MKHEEIVRKYVNKILERNGLNVEDFRLKGASEDMRQTCNKAIMEIMHEHPALDSRSVANALNVNYHRIRVAKRE